MIPAQAVSAVPAELFRDKIVLLGADYSITDRHRTPFAAVFDGPKGVIPGIVIHAHSVAQFLDGRPSGDAPFVVNFVIALALAGCGVYLGAIELQLILCIAVAVGGVILLWAAGFELFHYQRMMIELVTPTLSLALALWMTESLSGREARRQREHIRGLFSRYVSPKVVQQLVESASGLKLEGNKRVMTFIFTDVAGFTTLAESLGSRKLCRIVNAYLDGICQIVFRHDGTVDKFIGDAVFAIFNAPTDQPDHAERAVRCALEIDEFAERFRAEQVQKNVAFGATRIGVHTGSATVGNFGSLSRMEYTAVGDVVNTASRLEGLNKYFGTRICVSDVTKSHCANVAFRPLGIVTVKGKSIAHRIFEPVRPSVGDADYVLRYDEAFSSVERRDPAALRLLAALHEERSTDPCVGFYLDRLRNGQFGVELAMDEK
jgi:class 3 adenylate cyclase